MAFHGHNKQTYLLLFLVQTHRTDHLIKFSLKNKAINIPTFKHKKKNSFFISRLPIKTKNLVNKT